MKSLWKTFRDYSKLENNGAVSPLQNRVSIKTTVWLKRNVSFWVTGPVLAVVKPVWKQIEVKRDGDLDLVADLTSDVEVGRSGVACSCAVHCHTLILALVRFLAVLDLQRPCKHNTRNHKHSLTHSQTISTSIALNEGGLRKRNSFLPKQHIHTD